MRPTNMIHNMSSLASYAGDQSLNHLSTDPREMRWWHSPLQPSSVDSAKWPGDLPSSLFSIAVKTLVQIRYDKYIYKNTLLQAEKQQKWSPVGLRVLATRTSCEQTATDPPLWLTGEWQGYAILQAKPFSDQLTQDVVWIGFH